MLLPTKNVLATGRLQVYAIPVLSFIGSLCAPDKASHTLQCTIADPYNAIPTNLSGLGSVCRLVTLATRHRVAARTTTLNQGFEIIQTARGYHSGSVFDHFPVWEKKFLAHSTDCRSADVFNIVCDLENNGEHDKPQRKEVERCHCIAP